MPNLLDTRLPLGYPAASKEGEKAMKNSMSKKTKREKRTMTTFTPAVRFNNPEQIPCTVVGHFAVHRPLTASGLGSGWTVSHIPTGLNACRSPRVFHTRKQARHYAGCLSVLPLAWDTTDPTKGMPHELSQVIRRIGMAVADN